MTEFDLAEQIAASSGMDSRETAMLLEALTKSLQRHSTNLDSVAIPGFGTFITQKLDEELRDDLSTGRRMLFPPSIELSFKPSVVLRKKFVG